MAQSQKEESKTVDFKALRAELTKRNEEYIYRVEKFLQAQKLTSNQAQEKVNEHLEEIVQEQRKGRPANKVYGPASQFAHQLLNKKLKPEGATYADYPYWQLAVDSGLFYAVMFSVLLGIMTLFTSNRPASSQFGVLSVLAIALLFGIMMPYYNIVMQKPKSDRPKWWKLLIYFLIVIVIYMGITTVTMSLPSVVNPSLSGVGFIILAVVLFAIRYGFRKYYNIKYSPLNPTNAGRR
ncbi:DUF1129 family protein [Holzapfeliella floricola]|uniref:DUF1129 domain-containing protein n=1 Tax=Holzapfeliella floricola DSM 23037 = JCM 16512 TaxID=1423744 RepID=A0A0R2DL45_9LACO|nr:DUF1129 family protein [Holzapfeliella floricola]KRN04913.1 hypothetical protein FC86_GL000239 [Holzapfeliella floricola DSM 23037 = JCM 16512]